MKKLRITFATSALMIAAFFVLTASKPEGGYKVGDTAEDFKLKM